MRCRLWVPIKTYIYLIWNSSVSSVPLHSSRPAAHICSHWLKNFARPPNPPYHSNIYLDCLISSVCLWGIWRFSESIKHIKPFDKWKISSPVLQCKLCTERLMNKVCKMCQQNIIRFKFKSYIKIAVLWLLMGKRCMNFCWLSINVAVLFSTTVNRVLSVLSL